LSGREQRGQEVREQDRAARCQQDVADADDDVEGWYRQHVPEHQRERM
jgi:hypothetical protein